MTREELDVLEECEHLLTHYGSKIKRTRMIEGLHKIRAILEVVDTPKLARTGNLSPIPEALRRYNKALLQDRRDRALSCDFKKIECDGVGDNDGFLEMTAPNGKNKAWRRMFDAINLSEKPYFLGIDMATGNDRSVMTTQKSLDDSALAMSMAVSAKKHDIILEAINRKIGTNWTLEDLQARVHITKSPNTYEVFHLDGVELVAFGDPFFEQDLSQQPKHIVTAKINYKLY